MLYFVLLSLFWWAEILLLPLTASSDFSLTCFLWCLFRTLVDLLVEMRLQEEECSLLQRPFWRSMERVYLDNALWYRYLFRNDYSLVHSYPEHLFAPQPTSWWNNRNLHVHMSAWVNWGPLIAAMLGVCILIKYCCIWLVVVLIVLWERSIAFIITFSRGLSSTKAKWNVLLNGSQFFCCELVGSQRLPSLLSFDDKLFATLS